MTNRYLEKIASLDKEAFIKGFAANAKGLREATIRSGGTVTDHRNFLMKMREKAKGRSDIVLQDGFGDRLATAVKSLKPIDGKKSINRLNAHNLKGYGKSVESIRALEL